MAAISWANNEGQEYHKAQQQEYVKKTSMHVTASNTSGLAVEAALVLTNGAVHASAPMPIDTEDTVLCQQLKPLEDTLTSVVVKLTVHKDGAPVRTVYIAFWRSWSFVHASMEHGNILHCVNDGKVTAADIQTLVPAKCPLMPPAAVGVVATQFGVPQSRTTPRRSTAMGSLAVQDGHADTLQLPDLCSVVVQVLPARADGSPDHLRVSVAPEVPTLSPTLDTLYQRHKALDKQLKEEQARLADSRRMAQDAASRRQKALTRVRDASRRVLDAEEKLRAPPAHCCIMM